MFLLQNAVWPAFLVDGGGTIRKANLAAIEVFGSSLEGDSTMLSAIWGEESESAEQFITRWERSATTVLPIKFRAKGSVVTMFAAYIAAFHWEEERRLVFQLFRELPPPPGETRAGIVDAGLAHKQKLDCALQLARSVSLDFNNALTTILGHASLALSKMELSHPWRGSFAEIEKAAGKAAEVANQLAAFSRAEKDIQNLPAGNLNTVLRRVAETFQKSPAAARLTWAFDLEPRIYSACFDEAKLQQAFLKILENSLEAMGTQGQITVASRNLDVARLTHDGPVRLEPGAYVYCEITDTGRGIEPEVLPRVFEPFFTTKPGHRGLGLAWVYGIITNNGGGVVVASNQMQGASVRVYLPASKRVVLEAGPGGDDLRGNETVLVVDDEELVLNMSQTILSSFGYRVLTANSGQKALEIFDSANPAIELVVTDLVMPQMSGRELMEQIQARAPGLPILCTSGYIRATGTEPSGAFLPKPFTSQELLRRVKQVLKSVK